MKKYIKASVSYDSAGDILFELFYEYVISNSGISSSFSKRLSRDEYYAEFDKRFEDSVERNLIHALRDYDVSPSEIDFIKQAILDRAAKDYDYAYKKQDIYDELIYEWVLPLK